MKLNTCQRGAQVLEFAFILPFLVVLLMLVVDFGFMVYNKAIITNAAREAVRSGTVLTASPWSATSVAAVACSRVKNILIGTRAGTHTAACSGTADPVISVSNPNGNVPPQFNDPITVTVTYPFSGLLLNSINTRFGTFPMNLVSASTMNHE